MDSLRQLRVSTQLTQTIQDLHEETTLRLHNALQVSCTDFRPEPYSKVLQRIHSAMLPLCKVHWCCQPARITQPWSPNAACC